MAIFLFFGIVLYVSVYDSAKVILFIMKNSVFKFSSD